MEILESRNMKHLTAFTLVLFICLIFGGVVYADELADLKLAADNGDVTAQIAVADRYDTGDGVPNNPAEAAKWCRKAADQGSVDAQLLLGLRYDNGDGVAKNSVEAVKWYRKAADQGNVNAELFLGLHYDNGDGVIENPAEAAKWYRKAPDQGMRRRSVAWAISTLLAEV